MSCRGKTLHALGQCNCYFKPSDFVDLLAREACWLELLLRLARRRDRPEGVETEAISIMLGDRARQLRN
jgi:hypothetical protein